jgi:hypothetical protein
MPSVMEPEERDFWIAVTLWGAALVTLFGCGLYAFIEDSPKFGVFYTATGLGGLVYMTLHLKGHKLGPNPAFAGIMLALTWAFFGYTIWSGPRQAVIHEPAHIENQWPKAPQQPLAPNAAPGPAAADGPRVYTNKTIQDLAAFYKDRTTVQGDVFMADEKGKWINTEGKLQNLMPGGGVMLYNDTHPILCNFAEKWMAKLSVLRLSDFIKITGKIRQDQSLPALSLEQCELRD